MPLFHAGARYACALLILAPTPALARDEAVEFWFNPSIAAALDDDTALELETAQRLRAADDQREDTYYVRAWLVQDVADNVTLAGGVERRINDGGRDETRLLQQLSTRHGILRSRLRLEQRFVEGRGGRMGLRLRPRLGVAIPLDEAGNWAFVSDAELRLTLRATSADGKTGLTGLRTRIGVDHALSDRISLSLTYLRQQDFADKAADAVGHAPLIGLEFSF